jgi:hypothetical protein
MSLAVLAAFPSMAGPRTLLSNIMSWRQTLESPRVARKRVRLPVMEAPMLSGRTSASMSLPLWAQRPSTSTYLFEAQHEAAVQ